jgi:AraC-like DNA-binding protein
MAALEQVQTLYSTRGLEVTIVHCHRPAGHGTAEERAEAHGVALALAGVFVKHVDGRRVTADLNNVLYFNRGESFRVSHPFGGGDRCLLLTVAEPELVAMLASRTPTVQDRPHRPFAATHAVRSPRASLLQGRLLMALRRPEALPLLAEETALELLAEALPDGGVPSLLPTRARAQRRHAEIVARVQELLASRFREPLRLEELAVETGCSRFHLLRIFRRAVGVPIHRYQVRLRLRAAIERLADGERDLSAVALGLGFADHAHFTRAFSREFGTTPSAFRRVPRRRPARERSGSSGA